MKFAGAVKLTKILPMAIAVKLNGIEGLMLSINKTIKQAETGTAKALDKFQSNVVKDAKRAAPKNEGKLRNSITGSVTGLKAKVVVTANYAAYLEFGTRKFAAKYVATLPQDWKTYAATFKGSGGGTFDQFLQDLLQWVKAKKLRLEPKQMEQGDSYTASGKLRQNKKPKKQTIAEGQEQLAYVIALNILVEGIRAQPYLYPAVVKNTPVLIADIKKVFE
jgi:HK97 gp10 family phage protein